MSKKAENKFMSSELLSFESIYNKTNKDIFFFSQLIGISPELTYKLYYSIYNKIYLSIPLPKNIDQLNELLDKIIIKQSIVILTSYNKKAIFPEEYDLAKSFDREVENIQDVSLDKINTYINPEFITKVLNILSELPDGMRLCVALSCFKNVPLARMAKYMGIPLDGVKHMLYQAHEFINLWSKNELGEDSYTPLSFLPIVLQRAEQIDSKKNPPPSLSDTCANALNIKEQKVEKEQIDSFYEEEHTLDIMRKKPVELDVEAAKKAGIVLAAVVGAIIAAIFIVNLIIRTIDSISSSYQQPQEISYESGRKRVLHDRYQDPATGEYTEFSLRFIWGGDYEYTVTKDGYELTLMEGPKTIEDYAFRDCNDLVNIHLPESITNIGEDAFESCDNLKNLDIPSGVTEIGDSAFRNCNNLQSVNLPDGLLIIGEEAFESCGSLTQITIPKYVQGIKEDTFNKCWNLTQLTLLSSFGTFNFNIFGNNTPIKRIDLPDNINSLENHEPYINDVTFYCKKNSVTEETLSEKFKAPNIEQYTTD